MILQKFQSTSPGWRTTSCQASGILHPYISIHVPRVEDDSEGGRRRTPNTDFNPRPPGGGRLQWILPQTEESLFQSTSPGWRTTMRILLLMFSYPFQSTSPGWRTTRLFSNCRSRESISIHVPRVEDDTVLEWMSSSNVKFQSTSPGWRTTDKVRGDGESYSISIHVPRVEDDSGI